MGRREREREMEEGEMEKMLSVAAGGGGVVAKKMMEGQRVRECGLERRRTRPWGRSGSR